jgi:hypothetical protein
LGGIDALIGVIVLISFFWGLVDGSVSSFNIGIWIAILVALFAIMGGSLFLKARGHIIFAIVILSVLAIPGLLCGLFFFLILFSGNSWN